MPFISASSSTTRANRLSSLVHAVPGSVQDGDQLLLILSRSLKEDGDFVDPPGWSSVGALRPPDAASTPLGRVYVRVAFQEPAEYTFEVSGAADLFASVLLVYRRERYVAGSYQENPLEDARPISPALPAFQDSGHAVYAMLKDGRIFAADPSPAGSRMRAQEAQAFYGLAVADDIAGKGQSFAQRQWLTDRESNCSAFSLRLADLSSQRNFARLLSEARPDAQWTLPEVNDYSTLIWLSPGSPPTERQLLDIEEKFEIARADQDDARRAIAATLDARVRGELRKAPDPEALFDAAAGHLRVSHPNPPDRRDPANILQSIEDAKVGGPPDDRTSPGPGRRDPGSEVP